MSLTPPHGKPEEFAATQEDKLELKTVLGQKLATKGV